MGRELRRGWKNYMKALLIATDGHLHREGFFEGPFSVQKTVVIWGNDQGSKPDMPGFTHREIRNKPARVGETFSWQFGSLHFAPPSSLSTRLRNSPSS